MAWFNDAIFLRKTALAERLERPMADLAGRCALAWNESGRLDQSLVDTLPLLPHCRVLYALNSAGTQVSANISPEGVDPARRGQDLSTRPYLAGALPFRGFGLSHPYAGRNGISPCITALQAVHSATGPLGFVAADFDVKELPPAPVTTALHTDWRQYRGDPAIREMVFQQRRIPSVMDEHTDTVITLLDVLVREHGVFHSKLHLSSSRAVLWLYDDPYHYRLHTLAELIDPTMCLPYPKRPYPEEATLPPELVHPVLEQLKTLRRADETIYLRSASLNIMNGLVRLTFSCDGSHYLPAEEFLRRDASFWFG